MTAEAAGVPALVCITKLDLVNARDLEAIVELYAGLGYRVVLTSTVDSRGIAAMQEFLVGQTSILMGKSGVGKTSLLNAVEPDLGLRISEVGGGKIGKGRHTTTHLELVPLTGDGVVDTPGMRELGLWETRLDELARFFPELRPYLGMCKFGASCRHDAEPGCAVKEAVHNGDVSAGRYNSYLTLAREGSSLTGYNLIPHALCAMDVLVWPVP